MNRSRRVHGLSTVLLVLCASLAYADITVVNLVSNGSFETLPPLSSPDAPYLANCLNQSPPTNAALSCDDGISVAMVPWHIRDRIDALLGPSTAPGLPCLDGLACLDLNTLSAYTPGAITHPLTLTSGQTYSFFISIGAVATICGCPLEVPVRSINVSFYAAGARDAFSSSPLALNVSDQLCRWGNFSFDFIAAASDVLMDIASTTPSNPCGPVVDAVKIIWKSCIDGSSPPATGAGYTLVCADGWSVSPIAGGGPLAVNAPVLINGPLALPQLNVTLASPTGETLLQVDGVATLTGSLVLDVGGLAVGTTLVLINATRIDGAFTEAKVVRREGDPCLKAKLVQEEQTLSVLFTACENDTRLKKWQIGVIVLGVVIVVAVITVVSVILVKKLYKPRKRRAWGR